MPNIAAGPLIRHFHEFLRRAIFIERLWRSLKYEEVYLRDYRPVREAQASIGRYFQFYNYERLHQSLAYQTPAQLYLSAREPA